MPRFQSWYKRHAPFLKQSFAIKLFVFLTIFAFSYIIWSQYPGHSFSQYGINYVDAVEKEDAIQNVAYNPKYAEIYRKKSHLPKDTKYILLWTSDQWAPFYYFGKGQRGFIKNNCSMINCYVTSDRHFFGNDLTKFHAVAFNGRNIQSYGKNDLPRARSPHQKYIYFNTESSSYHPVCTDIFNGFFNWTASYRLDSDILFTYMIIKDKDGKIVGPKKHMTWLKHMDEIDSDFAERLLNKSKAAAWFASNCESKNKREKLANELQKALQKYGLNLDIYGSCGPLKCPLYRNSDCELKLEKDYYFYLSFENSFTKDYVTEKLLRAVQHNVVPIVYGGADYSRFLPPGSYLDARKLSAEELAATMHQLIQSPRMYQTYFRWKKYYSYHYHLQHNICNVCAALNNKTKYETTSVYYDMEEWWNVSLSECKNWFIF